MGRDTLTLSWRRYLPYRKQSTDYQWAGFQMIGISIMKKLNETPLSKSKKIIWPEKLKKIFGHLNLIVILDMLKLGVEMF